MSLSAMNSALFSPRKDYDANRLQSGILQLTAGKNERTFIIMLPCLLVWLMVVLVVKNYRHSFNSGWNCNGTWSTRPKRYIPTSYLRCSLVSCDCIIHFIINVIGVKNLTALSNVVRWQKVDYDFNYHQTEFFCDLVRDSDTVCI